VKKQSIVLTSEKRWNRGVQETKENPVMTAVLIIIALLAVVAVASTIVTASRDGYRRVPAIQR
jgi:hypothetical protein